MDRIADILDQIECLSIDTCTAVELAAFMSGADAVIHTAGSYCRRGESIAEAVRANVVFGLGILEAAIEQKVSLFINTSTALPKATNVYAQSKVQFAEWGRSLAESGGITFFNVLLEHIYGPGDDAVKFVEHVISACLANQEKLELTAGTQQRDFVHITDVVAAYLLLLEKKDFLGSGNYHDIAMGSGETVTIKSLVETIHAISGSSTLLAFGARPLASHEVMYSCATPNELRAMGWRTDISLEDGLQQIIHQKKSELPGLL